MRAMRGPMEDAFVFQVEPRPRVRVAMHNGRAPGVCEKPRILPLTPMLPKRNVRPHAARSADYVPSASGIA